MKYTFNTFTNVRDLTNHIKHILKCYGKFVPYIEGGDILNEETLVQYLGEFLDIPDNRRLFYNSGEVAGTLKNVLTTKKEYPLLIKSLKKYNKDLYGSLSETP